MAMLAEPRQKIRWTLNPRGKQWSEDSNKFGQRMLEKMGWSQGKGLGAKEQGITSHIAVNLKSDNRGVGFTRKDDDWCKHQETYDKLLANLSETMGSTGGDDPPKSLEETSKTSKARLHYSKFTRGKDLSKYSKKDLDCILGHKAGSEGKPSSSRVVEDVGSVDNSFGVTTIVGGNMRDYLKKKYSFSSVTDESSAEILTKVEKRKKKRNRSISDNGQDVLEVKGKRKKTRHGKEKRCKLMDNEEENNERPGDGMCVDEKAILPDLKLGRKEKKQKKRERKEGCPTSSERSSEEENFADDENSETLSSEMQGSDEPTVEKCKKKRKSKSADPTRNKLLCEITLSDSESNESAVRVESCTVKLAKKEKKCVNLDSVTNNPLGNSSLVDDKSKSCKQGVVDGSKEIVSKCKKNPKNIIVIDLASQDSNLKAENSKSKDEMMRLPVKVPDENVKYEDLKDESIIISNSELPTDCGLSDEPEVINIKDGKKKKKEMKIIDVDLSSKENVVEAKQAGGVMYKNIIGEKQFEGKTTTRVPKKTVIVDIATSESSGTSTEGVSCSALPKKLKKKTKQTVSLCPNLYSDVALVDLGDSEGCNELSMRNDRDRLDAGCLKASSSNYVTIDLTDCNDDVAGPVRNRKVDSKNSGIISHYKCLKKKESSDTSVSESVQVFIGVNLDELKGYGDK